MEQRVIATKPHLELGNMDDIQVVVNSPMMKWKKQFEGG